MLFFFSFELFAIVYSLSFRLFSQADGGVCCELLHHQPQGHHHGPAVWLLWSSQPWVVWWCVGHLLQGSGYLHLRKSTVDHLWWTYWCCLDWEHEYCAGWQQEGTGHFDAYLTVVFFNSCKGSFVKDLPSFYSVLFTLFSSSFVWWVVRSSRWAARWVWSLNLLTWSRPLRLQSVGKQHRQKLQRQLRIYIYIGRTCFESWVLWFLNVTICLKVWDDLHGTSAAGLVSSQRFLHEHTAQKPEHWTQSTGEITNVCLNWLISGLLQFFLSCPLKCHMMCLTPASLILLSHR